MSFENMSDSNRGRDLVLAPNEYAFISDQTKGNINVYVGPYKTSLANTDRSVRFDSFTKRFEPCSLDESIQLFATAPEGWYIVLKNPEQSGKQPTPGTPSNLASLTIGRKVNLPGPVCFALWPGQMTRVVQGHHLRNNQYLVVRVYDEAEARENWGKAVVKIKSDTAESNALPTNEIPDLAIGKLLVIQGAKVSFYIPPTGVEVVPDEYDTYVREAVTLERMEYCILKDENGEKRFHRGPNVVFPSPTEEFIEMDGKRKFKAIELNELSGLYIKVIADYTENGKSYREGDELFITGLDQMIYYPRPEHAIIKYGNKEKQHAIALPAGEGRYYLNRKTGTVSLKRGPCMFLPDPRTEVIVRRIIEPHKVRLWFPGNDEALQYNIMLRDMAAKEKGIIGQNVEEDFEAYAEGNEMAKAISLSASDMPAARRKEAPTSKKYAGDKLDRSGQFTPPRTITIDSKYDGAVNINVWNGYAVLVTSKIGTRKVIVGPQSYLLEYEEDLQTLEFSTGRPKSEDNVTKSVYLRTLNNNVSDFIQVETSDYCNISIAISYRLNFEGDPEKWFNVENYVLFLCEQMRSIIRNLAKKHPVTDFYAQGINLIRDTILGRVQEGKRKGRVFEENGMRIWDVEIFQLKLEDASIEKLLVSAQQNVVKQLLEVEDLKRSADLEKERQIYQRQITEARTETELDQIQQNLKRNEQSLQLQLHSINATAKQLLEKQEAQNIQQAKEEIFKQVELERNKAEQNHRLEILGRELALEIEKRNSKTQAITAKASAVSPELIAALQAFGDKALAEKMAESMAPMSLIGGKSIVEVFAQLVKGTQLSKYLDNWEAPE